MALKNNSFLKGIADGLPICFGYFSVAFAFGIFAVGAGLSVFEAVLISLANVTSAGQFSAVPIIAAGGGFVELALTQLIINLRYALMSVSLSQKFDKSVSLFDRFILAFVNTDEVFAVASAKSRKVSRAYMYGLIIPPYAGWSAGTFAGALFGDVFPPVITSALGVAIYGMFIAIVVPPCKKDKATAFAVLFAILLGCLFKYMPVLSKVSFGFVIIICAVVASAVFAIIAPVKSEEGNNLDT